MSGASAEIAIADAWARGVRGFDVVAAYEAGLRGALGDSRGAPAPLGAPASDGAPASHGPPASHLAPPSPGVDRRAGLEDALRLGFVPADRHEGAASETIEQAQADAALGRLAGALGREEDRALLEERGRAWRALYDPASGFLAGKRADGTFARPRFEWAWDAACTEGNARQWLWAPALFDLEGLAQAAGGEAALLARLEAFFEASAAQPDTFLPDLHYWHGNEPDIHAPYVFALLGRPDLTQRWAPLFQEARVRRLEGDLVIRAVGDPARERYVRGVTLDGRPLERPWVLHDEIARGAEIVFTLAAEPTEWRRR